MLADLPCPISWTDPGASGSPAPKRRPTAFCRLSLGFGLVVLSCGLLAQTNPFGLELLTLLVLQLLGPMRLTLLAMAFLLPAWLDHGHSSGARAWAVAVPAQP